MDANRFRRVESGVFRDFLGRDVSIHFTAIVTLAPGNREPATFIVHDDNYRFRENVAFVDRLLAMAPAGFYEDLRSGNSFVLQGDDCPTDEYSVNWSRKLHYNRVCILPDLYHVANNGYRDFLRDEVCPWAQRNSRIIWRGATTGAGRIDVDNLDRLPRYRLCKLAEGLGEKADFGIYHIIQCTDQSATDRVFYRLQNEGLMRGHMNMEDFQKQKFFMQIDGNANSWGVVKKLLLGCCIIAVDSPWVLWHSEQMRPWEHYVPVQSDLSNFLSVAEWCFSNDKEAEQIAQRARQLALSLNFEEEMKSANERLYPYLEFIDTNSVRTAGV